MTRFDFFPVATEHLLEFLPHRPPMVWIDSVLNLKESVGTCQVVVDRARDYCDENGVRPSALIEWMAQAYAFSGVLGELRAGRTPKIKKAFLAGFSQFEVLDQSELQRVELFEVVVEKKREFGPITLVSGAVHSNGVCVARAGLKLYSET